MFVDVLGASNLGLTLTRIAGCVATPNMQTGTQKLDSSRVPRGDDVLMSVAVRRIKQLVGCETSQRNRPRCNAMTILNSISNETAGLFRLNSIQGELKGATAVGGWLRQVLVVLVVVLSLSAIEKQFNSRQSERSDEISNKQPLCLLWRIEGGVFSSQSRVALEMRCDAMR